MSKALANPRPDLILWSFWTSEVVVGLSFSSVSFLWVAASSSWSWKLSSGADSSKPVGSVGVGRKPAGCLSQEVSAPCLLFRLHFSMLLALPMPVCSVSSDSSFWEPWKPECKLSFHWRPSSAHLLWVNLSCWKKCCFCVFWVLGKILALECHVSELGLLNVSLNRWDVYKCKR